LCDRFDAGADPATRELGWLLGHGVAFHHAGLLPATKEIVERCFATRLVKLVFATETFALGINMPARSVVLDSLWKRDNDGVRLLRGREFLQMTGRAGRRGMDREGFAYVRVDAERDTRTDVQSVIDQEPEPVRSRFNAGYATLLQLYRQHGPGLLDLMPQTLFHRQLPAWERDRVLETVRGRLQVLEVLGCVARERLTDHGRFAARLYGYELLLTELNGDGCLARLQPVELGALVLGIVFLRRPGTRAKRRIVPLNDKLFSLCRGPLQRVHKAEEQAGLHILTRAPDFLLTRSLQLWMKGGSFNAALTASPVDQGEVLYGLRMTVRLLREISETDDADDNLRQTAAQAIACINRDVIDAEAELRASCRGIGPVPGVLV